MTKPTPPRCDAPRCKALFVFLSLWGLSSCTPKGNPSPSEPWQAFVMAWSPLSDGSAHFTYGPQTLASLKDPENLAGDYFHLVEGGELKVKEINGSLVESDSFTGGKGPELRFSVNSDGVIEPKDFKTAQMFSAFYQLDTIYKNLLAKTGISPSEFKTHAGNIPILFEPKISFVTNDQTGDVVQKLNAAFVPVQRQFLLFQRSKVESIPLAANLQVLAHEFGHAIFEFAWDKTGSDKAAEESVMRGINEGFADFTSYTFTGNTDILRSSIDIAKIADQRNFSKTSFLYGDLDKDLPAGDPKLCSGGFYCIGTLFAKTLYEVQSERHISSEAMEALVINTLKGTLSRLEKPTDASRKAACAAGGSASEIGCKYDDSWLSAFLKAFAKEMDGLNSEVASSFRVRAAYHFNTIGKALNP